MDVEVRAFPGPDRAGLFLTVAAMTAAGAGTDTVKVVLERSGPLSCGDTDMTSFSRWETVIVFAELRIGAVILSVGRGSESNRADPGSKKGAALSRIFSPDSGALGLDIEPV